MGANSVWDQNVSAITTFGQDIADPAEVLSLELISVPLDLTIFIYCAVCA